MGSHRILILGGGFGGIYTALRLERWLLDANADTEVTLVTRDNYFLFTPLLHEIAACDLEVTTIVNPLRKLLRRVNSFVGNVLSIDLDRKSVLVSHGLDDHSHKLPYDQLVLAPSAAPPTFSSSRAWQSSQLQ
jgi:NADH:ubiquinone reductase (H+-translocating)